MSDTLRELLAFFDVEVNSAPLKQADKEISGLKNTIRTAAVAIASYFAVDTFAGAIRSSVEFGATLDDTAQRLGVSTDELQAFQYAAKLSGASVEDANNGLKFFQKNLGEAADKGGDAAAAFGKLGVNIRDQNGNVGDTLTLLTAAAEGFTKLKTPAERTTVAMQLFGRGGAALIPLLNQGQAGVSKLYAEFQRMGGGLNAGAVKALADADDELDRLSISTRIMKAEIVAALVPALKELVTWVTDGVGQLREFAKHSYIVQTVMGTLTAAAVIAGIAWGILNLEVLLIVAALALLVLAIDDVYTWMQGGDSVIGRFIDSIFGKGQSAQFLKDLKHTFFTVEDQIENTARQAMALWFIFRDLGDELGVTFGSGNLGQLNTFQQSLGAVVLSAKVGAETFGLLAHAVAYVVDGLKTFAKDHPELANIVGQGINMSNVFSGTSGRAPSISSNASSQSATQNNDVEINVHGVKDADGAARAASGAVKQTLLGLRGAYASIPGGG